jgi:hypothetical protein
MIYSTIRLRPVGQATPNDLIAEVLLGWVGQDGVTLLGYDREQGHIRSHWFPSLDRLQVYVAETLGVPPERWVQVEEPASMLKDPLATLAEVSQMIFKMYYQSTWSSVVASVYKSLGGRAIDAPYFTLERLKDRIRTQVPKESLHEMALPYIRHLLQNDPKNRVLAIKVYRRLTWRGLKDSRDIVYAIHEKLKLENPDASEI